MEPKFNITLTESQMSCNPPMDIATIAQIACSAIVSLVQNAPIPEGMTEENVALARRSLHDDLNLIFSNTLTMAFPELELRPELSELAIMQLENQMIEEATTQIEAEPVPTTEADKDNILQFPVRE